MDIICIYIFFFFGVICKMYICVRLSMYICIYLYVFFLLLSMDSLSSQKRRGEAGRNFSGRCSGGEHGGRMRPDYEGTRPGPYLAGHCSLHWIGRVYSRLVRFFGRDKVVVVAQLHETLKWLREASKDEESAKKLAGRSALLPMLRQQLAEVLESCADLIADGGAHYDGQEAGPSSISGVQVLP